MKERKQPSCLVVMYHYVHDAPPVVEGAEVGPHQGIRGLSTKAFADQVDLLCLTREPIDWSTLRKGIGRRTSLPRESFLLTFDDGLGDHARHVAPILEDRGLSGVFFVPGEVLTERRMLSAHAVHLLLSRLGDVEFASELRAAVRSIGQGLKPETSLVAKKEPADSPSTAYHYESTIRAEIKTWLHMRLPIDLRRRMIDALFEHHVGVAEAWADRWYLSRDDVVGLHAKGHTVGGHGYMHEPLARLNGDAQQADAARSAQTLTELLGPDDRPFSYPFGSLDKFTVEACRSAGFVLGVTTESRLAGIGDDAMRVPRVDTIHVNQFLENVPVCP